MSSHTEDLLDLPPIPLSIEIKFIPDHRKEDEGLDIPPTPLSIEIEFIPDHRKENENEDLDIAPNPLSVGIEFTPDRDGEEGLDVPPSPKIEQPPDHKEATSDLEISPRPPSQGDNSIPDIKLGDPVLVTRRGEEGEVKVSGVVVGIQLATNLLGGVLYKVELDDTKLVEIFGPRDIRKIDQEDDSLFPPEIKGST